MLLEGTSLREFCGKLAGIWWFILPQFVAQIMQNCTHFPRRRICMLMWGGWSSFWGIGDPGNWRCLIEFWIWAIEWRRRGFGRKRMWSLQLHGCRIWLRWGFSSRDWCHWSLIGREGWLGMETRRSLFQGSCHRCTWEWRRQELWAMRLGIWSGGERSLGMWWWSCSVKVMWRGLLWSGDCSMGGYLRRLWFCPRRVIRILQWSRDSYFTHTGQ